VIVTVPVPSWPQMISVSVENNSEPSI